jgi:hypothetical protein
MKVTPQLALTFLLALLSLPAQSQIVVDQNGGGDYLTIQEGVDAASPLGETVLVMPGVYAEWHEHDVLGTERRVNVYFEGGITLISAGGPGVTIIDGGGVTEYGVIALPIDAGIPGIPPFTPVVEGFTVRNGWPWYPSKGIVAVGGEALGNVVTGYHYGLASGAGHDYTGISGGRSRELSSLIAGNTATDNNTGICIDALDSGFVEALVTENAVTDNACGVFVTGPDNSVRLVGNEICLNGTGIYVDQGSSTSSGHVHVEMARNLIADNTARNIRVYNSWSWSGHWTDLDIGGSIQDANDIYGSPQNMMLVLDGGVEIDVDARYNYWGSTFCDEFEPLFHTEGMDDSLLLYLPYVDESHAVVYEECEFSSTENTSWGAIKALYR